MATLTQRVNTIFGSREKNGVAMLSLVHDCVTHIGQEKDWDAAAQFLSKAGKIGDKIPDRVMRGALWAYFGDVLKLRKVTDHPTGFRLSFGTSGKWPAGTINPSNHYAVIANAVEAGMSIDNPTFLKALADERASERTPTDEKTPREKLVARAKPLAKALFQDNIPTSVLVQAIEKELAALKAQQAKETANVVPPNKGNGNVTSHDDLMENLSKSSAKKEEAA